MKVRQNGPTVLVPGKTVIFLGVKSCVPPSTLKMRKSHKKLARVYAYTHAYTRIRDGGGKSAPPPFWAVPRLQHLFWNIAHYEY